MPTVWQRCKVLLLVWPVLLDMSFTRKGVRHCGIVDQHPYIISRHIIGEAAIFDCHSVLVLQGVSSRF